MKLLAALVSLGKFQAKAASLAGILFNVDYKTKTPHRQTESFCAGMEAAQSNYTKDCTRNKIIITKLPT